MKVANNSCGDYALQLQHPKLLLNEGKPSFALKKERKSNNIIPEQRKRTRVSNIRSSVSYPCNHLRYLFIFMLRQIQLHNVGFLPFKTRNVIQFESAGPRQVPRVISGGGGVMGVAIHSLEPRSFA